MKRQYIVFLASQLASNKLSMDVIRMMRELIHIV